MKPEFTKLLDLYKGFEGEPGYFFAATDKEKNIHYYIKTWEGYIGDIFYKDPHMPADGWFGFTKLFHEVLDGFDFGLDNFYKVDNNKEFLDDLVWYKNNRFKTYDENVRLLLNSLIELAELAIKDNLEIMIANDEDA